MPDAVLRGQLAEIEAVVDGVRGEPFDGVHEVTPEVVPMLVAAVADDRPPDVDASAPPGTSRTARIDVTFGLQVSQFTWPGGPPRSARTCVSSPAGRRRPGSRRCT